MTKAILNKPRPRIFKRTTTVHTIKLTRTEILKALRQYAPEEVPELLQYPISLQTTEPGGYGAPIELDDRDSLLELIYTTMEETAE